MIKAKGNFQLVQTALIDCIMATEEGAEWKAIKVYIEARFIVKNWLTEVRGPLQAILDGGFIRRWSDPADLIASVSVERYIPNL